MNQSKVLLNIQFGLERLKKDLSRYTNEDLEDGASVILRAYSICEQLIALHLSTIGCAVSDELLIYTDENNIPLQRPILPGVYIRRNRGILPDECVELVSILNIRRNQVAHQLKPLSKETIAIFSKAFDAFVFWFVSQYKSGDGIAVSTTELVRINNRFFSLSQEIERIIDTPKQDPCTYLGSQIEQLRKDLLGEMQNIKSALSELDRKVSALSEKICDYQNLIEQQLNYAQSNEEIDAIIQGYSDVCVNKCVSLIQSHNTTNEFEKEKNELINVFGPSWDKLDEASKTFLVTAKMIYRNLIGLEDVVDYSGVCLLVTKALEVELRNRFCRKFLIYLKKHYPGKQNYDKYPTGLRAKYDGAYRGPIKEKQFTLGSVAFILCYYQPNDITAEQETQNKERLIEFCQDEIFESYTEEQIFNTLTLYAQQIEDIKNDFRNPSAHTNELQRVDADRCFALVIDIEKFLIKMLESFKI